MVTMDAARTQSSDEIVSAVTRLAAEGRAVMADLIALLAVLDERRLFEAEGCGSLFEFCVTRLRLSESQAYHRIQAARAAARFPVILERLREGAVTLTSVALLRPVLTAENHARLLSDAAGRTKREVEGLVRALVPLPDVATLRVTISEGTHAKLRRCQDLLGHAVPDGDAAVILDRALTVLVAQLERRKFATTRRRSADGTPSQGRRLPTCPSPTASMTALGRRDDAAADGRPAQPAPRPPKPERRLGTFTRALTRSRRGIDPAVQGR